VRKASRSAARLSTALLAALLLPALLLIGAAGAQYAYSKLNLAGRDAQALVLGGAEYASETSLQGLVRIIREYPYVRVQGLGHDLLLPIDQDQNRAATTFNTVQLDTTRIQARTATLLNGEVYLPLDTLARGLGAQYRTGSFSLPAAALSNVASRAGKDADRIVLDLTRDAEVVPSLGGESLILLLRGVSAKASSSYGTRGAFVPKFTVASSADGAKVNVPLGAGAGYRFFKVVRPGSVRVVIDVGPGLPRNVPKLLDAPRSPLIVLDPAPAGGGSDLPLEVARATGELLSKAGWQVKLTRSAAGRLPIAEREQMARRSQVFVTLSLGRFPGAPRRGLTLYQPSGEQDALIVNALRENQDNPLAAAAVGNGGETKRLSELLLGELSARGLRAATQPVPKLYLPGEAPHAAFELELGWPQNAGDLANLLTPQRTTKVSEALALSVATFLRARLANSPLGTQ
jgi:N-acetylmuramoyl-L-alanine amidase